MTRFFYTVAEKSPIPIVLYNAPKFTGGVSISPALASLLARHENIVALKNSSPTANRDYIQATEGMDFEIIAGNIGNFYTGLLEGCKSGVLSTASYLPEYCTLLYNYVIKGQLKEAEALSEKLQSISSKTAGNLAAPGVKCAMDIRGSNGGKVRLPLLDLNEAEKQRFISVFKDFGLERLEKTGKKNGCHLIKKVTPEKAKLTPK